VNQAQKRQLSRSNGQSQEGPTGSYFVDSIILVFILWTFYAFDY
jgi:hypothetical protein